MDTSGESLDLRFYLGVLRRRSWIVAVSTILVGVAALGASLLQHDVYEAGADVLIGRQASDQVFSTTGQVYDPSRNLQTEVKVLESRTVSQAAEKAVGGPVDVRIGWDTESDVVAVLARSEDPAAAARAANAYAQAYVDYRLQSAVDRLLGAGREVDAKIAEIDAQLAALPGTSTQRAALEDQRAYLVEQQGRLEVSANLADAGGAAVLARAETPVAPVEPKPVRNAVLGAILGFLLGVGIAFLREFLDDTVKDRSGLERVLGEAVPIIAEIPNIADRKRKGDAPLVVVDDLGSGATEAFGMLRTSILFRGLDSGVTVYQITSANPSEGKSTVAANLAVSLALAKKRVVIVDLDLRRPRVHQYFGLSNRRGVTSLMVGDASVHEAMRRVNGLDGLFVMPSGPVPANPSEIMASSRLSELMTMLSGPVDVVIVDSPPVLAVADAMALARVVDATILVARAGSSSRRAIHRAVDSLRQVGAPLIGAVLNGVDLDGSAYAYRYGYGSEGAKASSRGERKPRREAAAPTVATRA